MVSSGDSGLAGRQTCRTLAAERDGRASKLLGPVRNLLAHRRSPLFVAVLATILALPSLGQGWVADDLIQRKLLLGSRLPALLKGLFVFVHPRADLQIMDLSTELGTLPWWTLDTLHISFFRPLAVLTHWLDYQLWPDSSALMHAQSLLWYGGLCVLVTLFYRRVMGRTWVAGLAGFLFAVNVVHLGSATWLSNRNGLLAVFFGLLTLVAHDQWRQEQWRVGAYAALLFLALALLSGEGGVTTGAYLVAYAVFLDHGPWRERLGALAPYAFVAIPWRLVYRQMGFGTWGSGFYVDPVQEPLRFAAAVAERGPILFLSQWLGQVPMPYNLLALLGRRAVWLIALLFMVLVGVASAPLVRRNRVARFWAVAMVLAVVPACSIRLLSGRLLLFADVGAMALMAQFIHSLFDRAEWLPVHRAQRFLIWFLATIVIGFHFVLAPVLMPIVAKAPDSLQAIIVQVTDIGPLADVAPTDVVIVNPPSPFHFIYVPSLRSLQQQSMPAHMRLLAPGYFSVDVTRLDAHTVRVRPEHGYLAPPGMRVGHNSDSLPFFHFAYMYQHLDKFFRSDAFRMSRGQLVQLSGMQAEVTALANDGRPLEAEIRFDKPLDDPSLVWLHWDWQENSYVPSTPPKVGETLRIAGPF